MRLQEVIVGFELSLFESFGKCLTLFMGTLIVVLILRVRRWDISWQ